MQFDVKQRQKVGVEQRIQNGRRFFDLSFKNRFETLLVVHFGKLFKIFKRLIPFVCEILLYGAVRFVAQPYDKRKHFCLINEVARTRIDFKNKKARQISVFAFRRKSIEKFFQIGIAVTIAERHTFGIGHFDDRAHRIKIRRLVERSFQQFQRFVFLLPFLHFIFEHYKMQFRNRHRLQKIRIFKCRIFYFFKILPDKIAQLTPRIKGARRRLQEL